MNSYESTVYTMVDTDAWFPANSEPVKDVNTKQTSGLWLIQYTVHTIIKYTFVSAILVICYSFVFTGL